MSTLVHVMAWWHQAPSHNMKPCRPNPIKTLKKFYSKIHIIRNRNSSFYVISGWYAELLEMLPYFLWGVTFNFPHPHKIRIIWYGRPSKLMAGLTQYLRVTRGSIAVAYEWCLIANLQVIGENQTSIANLHVLYVDICLLGKHGVGIFSIYELKCYIEIWCKIMRKLYQLINIFV